MSYHIYCRMCCDNITYFQQEDVPTIKGTDAYIPVEEFRDCLEHWDKDEMRREIERLRKEEKKLWSRVNYKEGLLAEIVKGLKEALEKGEA